MSDLPERQHGGADAAGGARFDFSTNSNACGPCPQAQIAVREADATRYPDPRYAALREALAQWHGVARWQIVAGASSSELIHRLLLWARLRGVHDAIVPTPAYGDYAHQARALGLRIHSRRVATAAHARRPMDDTPPSVAPAMEWICQPSSPQGLDDARLVAWTEEGRAANGAACLRVLDAAYEPLVLADRSMPWRERAQVRQALAWQLFSPNKALGLTGVRAAYAIAPHAPGCEDAAQCMARELEALAPSWPLGAHGVALLHAWTQPPVQAWLAASRQQLQQWKRTQIALCRTLGWQVEEGSVAHFFVVRPSMQEPTKGTAARWQQVLQQLREVHQIKLRDTASMGLPGHLRVSVQPPAAQAALAQAWRAVSMHLHHGVPLNTP